MKKRTLSIEELEARMRPGQLSQVGFLGENERLEYVIQQDERSLKNMGITHEELAEKLDYLLRTARDSSGGYVRIGNFEVKLTTYTGFQICPWSPDIHGGQCTAGKGVDHASVDWHIHNIGTGQEMRGSGLIVHLIRDHHFFEGLKSPYRVDPHKLADLLSVRS